MYRHLKIQSPQELGIDVIARKLNLNVLYGGVSLRFGNDFVIKKSTKQKEWQLFGHEVGHYLRHYGNHLVMHYLFMDLQELQANHFAYHFCIPTFMLQDLYDLNVYQVMNLFNVEYEFAQTRLSMYQNKLIMGGNHVAL
ncbi:Zn-dependent peptidase ImmA (M78 family) [Virgibacillus litoralis]|uniref:Zn-dependent peptidase ImmA (M78 family) n=1 Tax=Virgibacillus litoralis TaxID=578221 RepID=A0ABS4HC56_9BACI|nr:ImmA/IrrE family metallo-endopeptidase [Virgibacillus litoralis]MBP1948481.1 Zn-dependent peptidase ImmA (M78 family) [Virgibacillus litoralis]